MKVYYLVAILCLLAASTSAQADSSKVDEMSLSFQDHYRNAFPRLHYSYNPYSQLHDYSGNWDIDGDGMPDKIFFIGNGAAHVYFHLMVILSSDNEVRDYPWLALDMPALRSMDEMEKAIKHRSDIPSFAFYHFETKDKDQLIFCLDKATLAVRPSQWKKIVPNSRYLRLSYRQGNIIIGNYKN